MTGLTTDGSAPRKVVGTIAAALTPDEIVEVSFDNVVHVEEPKLLLSTDETIWDYALKHQHIIITKDEDFKNMLLLAAISRTPVVWVRIGNCSNAAVTRWFQPLFPQVLRYLQQGEYLIELY